MKVKYSEAYEYVTEYKIPGTLYSIVNSLATYNKKEAQKAFMKLYALMKYHAPNYGVYFLIGLSNTVGKTARKVLKQVRGNAKIEIRGKREPYHIHAVIAGERSEEFAKYILARRNKLDGVTHTSSMKLKDRWNDSKNNNKGAHFIAYVYRQSEATLSYAEDGFDFKNFEGVEGCDYRVAQD